MTCAAIALLAFVLGAASALWLGALLMKPSYKPRKERP